MTPKFAGVDLPQVDTIDQYLSGGWIEQAWNQIYERALSRAGVSDQGDRRPGGDSQVDIGQRPSASIGDGDPAKLDFAPNRWNGCGMFGSGNGRRFMKQFIDPPQGSAAALRQIDHPAEGNHGPNQHSHVGVEHYEGTHGDPAGQHLLSSDPEHNKECQPDQ